MSEIVLNEVANNAFQRSLDGCKRWASEHQAEIGVAEMALGAAILSWGVASGHVFLGHDLAPSKLADVGGLTGLGIGAGGSAVLALTLLKGVFVGGVGLVSGVTCIPAVAIIGGGSMILGSFGYVLGDKVDALFQPLGFDTMLMGASIVAVGTALLVDGARRIVKDERLLAAASKFKDGVVELVPQTSEIVAASWDDLQRLVTELAKSPSGYATVGTTAFTGAAIGSSLAVGSVSILGSSGLGAAALSLGLISAPVWPVIAGGALGLTLGVAAWKGVRRYRARPEAEARVATLVPAKQST